MSEPNPLTSEPGRRRRSVVPRVIRQHPEYRFLLASFGISGIGDWMYSVAVAVWILDTTHSAGWMSAAVIVRMLPYALFSSVAGTIADRVDRRRLMIGLDLARAAMFAAMAVVTTRDGTGWVVLVLGMVFVSTVFSTPYQPAVVAVTPLVVGEDDIAGANGIEGTVGQLTWFVGPALGSLVLAATSVAWTLVGNAATFLLSALLVARVHGAARSVGERADDADRADDATFREHFLGGVRALRTTPGALLLTGFVAIVLFAWGFELVLHVVVAERRLGIGAEGVGWMTAAIGLGGITVAPFTGRLAGSRRSGAILAASGLLLGVPLALLGTTRSPGVAYGLLYLEGVGNVAFEVLAVTMLQRLVANELLGRVQGIQDQIGALASLGGAIAAPVFVERLSLTASLGIGGAALTVYSAAALPRFGALDRRMVAARAALAPRVAVLRDLAVFDGASVAALERVARVVHEERFDQGASIIIEGDAADDFFVVVSGALSVRTDSLGIINQLGAGDCFGEIGLVDRRPRTATVLAETDVEVWRIPGEQFLAALHADAVANGSLRSMIGERLARSGG